MVTRQPEAGSIVKPSVRTEKQRESFALSSVPADADVKIVFFSDQDFQNNGELRRGSKPKRLLSLSLIDHGKFLVTDFAMPREERGIYEQAFSQNDVIALGLGPLKNSVELDPSISKGSAVAYRNFTQRRSGEVQTYRPQEAETPPLDPPMLPKQRLLVGAMRVAGAPVLS